jgi:hypothetical protein
VPATKIVEEVKVTIPQGGFQIQTTTQGRALQIMARQRERELCIMIIEFILLISSSSNKCWQINIV